MQPLQPATAPARTRRRDAHEHASHWQQPPELHFIELARFAITYASDLAKGAVIIAGLWTLRTLLDFGAAHDLNPNVMDAFKHIEILAGPHLFASYQLAPLIRILTRTLWTKPGLQRLVTRIIRARVIRTVTP